jgi:hypothetical protein
MESLKNYIEKEIILNIKDNKVFLNNIDFEKGTYRIVKPGYYVLKEDIIFNPNCPFFYTQNSILDENKTKI